MADDLEVVSPITCELQIVENDSRAKQFACKIIIGNHTRHAMDILAINYRLGRGVSMQMNEDNSFVDLKEEYDAQRSHVKFLLSAAIVNASQEFRDEYVTNTLQTFKKQISLRSFGEMYFYLATNRLSMIRRLSLSRFGQMDYPIATAEDAAGALANSLEKGYVKGSVGDLLAAKISRMAAIQKLDQNFLRPEYVTQLQPNETYERVYVLKASRRLASIASYSVAFDTKVRWDEASPEPNIASRTVERIISRATSFNVTPSPLTLSLYAIIFSFIGVMLAALPTLKGNYLELLEASFLKQYFVGAALAVILYNSLEMTEFSDRVSSISWRSAMFVGVLCGLLSDRMLQAITAFVK